MKCLYKVLAVVALAIPVFSGCKSDNLDTNQYSETGVRLVSYGPNPVMRGGALTFTGSNLDRIVEVQIPGIDPITEIEVLSTGIKSEIRVILPVEGPEVGALTLVSSDGNKFTTGTELEYTEPIVLESFSTESTPAYPRDVLKLKGDYMNLVKSVIFEGGTAVAVVNIDRHNATATIPSTAVSGKIVLSDEGEIANLIYSEESLTIGDPTVSSVKADAWKPGKTATVSGKYLDMVEQIRLGGDVIVETEDIEISSDYKSLMFTVPEGMKSGDVVAVSYAGKEFKAGSVEMVEPTGLSVSPASVTFGGTISISGKDLDVVTAVTFPNADAVTDFKFADNKISLEVPVKARGGDIVLTMANGETVSVAYTLISPTVTSVSPLSLMAGETVTLNGTGLQFVESATLGGKSVEIKANEDGTQLVITTANTSVSGKIVLTLYNGETIEPEEEITLSYDALIIVNEMPASEHIGGMVTLKGENFMLIENIYIGEAKVTGYSSRSDNEISFVMPYNKIGVYPVYFDLLNGDRETCPQSIDVLLELKYITAWEGSLPITWGDGGRVIVPASKFDGIKAGTKMRLYYTYDDDTWCQAQMNYGNWSPLIFPEIGSEQLAPVCSYKGKGAIDWCTEVTLTAEILSGIEAKKAEAESVKAAGIIIQGSDITFTKIEIVQEISQEKTIWEGSAYTGADYNNNLELGTENDWLNAGIEIGNTVKIYFSAESETDWQIQLFDGHWSGMSMLFPDQSAQNQFNATNSPTAISDGYISFEVTAEIYAVFTSIQGWGYALICQGKGITFTKIGLN